MREFIKNKKYILLIVLISIFVLPLTFSFSRYIFNSISENYYTSKKFYFNSSMLNGNTHTLYNFDGVGEYTFKVDVTNSKDSLNYTAYNIDYTVSLTCKKGSTDIPCSYVDSSGGTLLSSNSSTTNYLMISVNPTGISLVNGDEIEVIISATSTTNYHKTLSSTFMLVVNEKNISYSITDSVNSLYLDLVITNNKEDRVLNIDFDESALQIDLSNVFVKSAVKHTNVNNKINSISFTIAQGQTYSIKFYKIDPTQSYNLNSEVISFR